MKKRFIAILMTAAMLALTACGGTSSTAPAKDDAAEETNEANETVIEGEEKILGETGEEPLFTFENGQFKNSTFTMTVPEGWNVDESYYTTDRIRFLHAEDKDAFDVYSNGSLDVSFKDFAYDIDRIDELIENDEQFFEEGFEVEDYTLGAYTGKITSGMSKSYADCFVQIAEVECWHEGTNDVSRGQIRISYYTDEEAADIESMIASIQTLTDTGNAAAAEAAAEAEEIGEIVLSGCVTITPPQGWNIVQQRDYSVELSNDRFSMGSITINAYENSDRTADEWAEGKRSSFNDAGEIITLDMCGKTFTGFHATSIMDMFCCVLDNGVRVEMDTYGFTLDQCQDLIDTITITE